MSELIDRQAAIDTIMGQPPEPHYPSWYAAQIEKLPPAQPHQIVRCKDCKWGAQDEDGWWYCVEIGGRMGDGEKGDGFCSDAERREDG